MNILSNLNELSVVRVEKLLVGIVVEGLPSVFAHVEHLGAHAYPMQIAVQLLRYVRFATSGQTHQANDSWRLNKLVSAGFNKNNSA